MVGRKRATAADFWSRVEVQVGDDACWLWTGTVHHTGYGIGPRLVAGTRQAHRIAWVLENGPVPEGLFVCHRCDVRLCVRPDHLYAGTHLDNMRDMRERLRSAAGTRVGTAKLDAIRVTEIRAALAAHEPRCAIAGRFGVCKGTVRLIELGLTWRREAA